MGALLGKKLGMTSIFSDDGESVPCTVIEAGPCPVVMLRTKDNDGYDAVQIGFGEIEDRKVNQPTKGHFKKSNTTHTRYLKEFKNIKAETGEVLTVEQFQSGDMLKISSNSKGRGFQGVVKRHHFRGVGMTTHGQSDRVRAPGSIGGSSYPSRVFPGMRMAGRMGGKRTSIRNIEVLQVLPEQNLILVKGSIPGAPNSIIEIVKL
ncbi:MAG: 50S ribosomal protein L3 [Candidatus Kapabacteria bacterium]|nr:50S ribosomal protein L3 [Candidatus Kapabacteria bacterium]MBX7153806.1 50S ribosomal protein L3 [Bacteroidota bacterium]